MRIPIAAVLQAEPTTGWLCTLAVLYLTLDSQLSVSGGSPGASAHH